MNHYFKRNWKKIALVCAVGLLCEGLYVIAQMVMMQGFDAAINLDFRGFLVWTAVNLGVYCLYLAMAALEAGLVIHLAQRLDAARKVAAQRAIIAQQQLYERNAGLLTGRKLIDFFGKIAFFKTKMEEDAAHFVFVVVAAQRFKTGLKPVVFFQLLFAGIFREHFRLPRQFRFDFAQFKEDVFERF